MELNGLLPYFRLMANEVHRFLNAQSHVDDNAALERLRIVKSYVKLTHALLEVAFPSAPQRAHADLDMLMVLMAVGIGEGDGRPMSPTKISHFTGIPRPTVHRKLKWLIKARKITRVGRVYHYARDGMNADPGNRLRRAVAELCGTS